MLFMYAWPWSKPLTYISCLMLKLMLRLIISLALVSVFIDEETKIEGVHMICPR